MCHDPRVSSNSTRFFSTREAATTRRQGTRSIVHPVRVRNSNSKKKATEKKHRRKKILFLLYFKPTRAAAASFVDFDYRSREAICIPCIIEHAPLVNGRDPVFCRLETVARFHYGREPFLAPLLFSTPPLSFFSFFFVLFRTRKSALVPERERGRGSERERDGCLPRMEYPARTLHGNT